MALADIPRCEIDDLWQGDFSFLALYDLYTREKHFSRTKKYYYYVQARKILFFDTF